MNRSNRGRKPNKLNLISTSFLKSNGRALDAEKFADDKSNTLALKIFRLKSWKGCLPMEVCSQLNLLTSIKNTKTLTKEVIKTISTSAENWISLKNNYKSRNFEARICKDLKIKFIGREDRRWKTFEDLVDELFNQLIAKKLRKGSNYNDDSDEAKSVEDSTRIEEVEEKVKKTEAFSPLQESNPSEPNYSFDELQDDEEFLRDVLNLPEDDDLASSRTRN